MKTKNNDLVMQKKVFVWIAAVTGGILTLPLIARASWTLSDFVIMGILLFGAGSIFVLAARKMTNNRLIVGLVVAAVFLWLWAELAVGIFTRWGS